MLPTKFRFIWPNGYRREDFSKSANQRNKSRLWQPCLLTDRDEKSNEDLPYTLPTKFQFICLRGFRTIFICNSILWLISIFKLELSPFPQKNRFFFLKHTIINMNCLWRPCLLMVRDEMSYLYRGPSIDVSYQVSVHLAQWFHRRRFLKIGQSETKIACGGHVC